MKLPVITLGVLFATLLVGTGDIAQADIIELFGMDDGAGGSIAGDTYSLTRSGLVADGVTFNATLTVIGTPQAVTASLDQNSNGLGIDSAGTDSVLVDNGEFLTFSMSVFNFVGGTVVFDGFTGVDFNNFGTGDVGVFSIDHSAATLGDNFFTTTNGANVVDISATLPTVFSAIAEADGVNSNSFRIDDVSAQFSGTLVAAVPEPSSLAFLGLLAGGFWARRVRQRRHA